MILVQDTVISDDVAKEQFVCDLNKCKGACCVEGDLGAPLEEEELEPLKKALPEIKPYVMKEGWAEIERQGPYILDFEGDYSTPTINGKECAYVFYDEQGTLKCGIEQAYLDGKVDFHKPISCHLYPIRITKHEHYDAINYDWWEICSDACTLGKELKVPVYKFLKAPLIRKYGKAWYKALEEEIKEKEEDERDENQ